jgi:hypothetical protein
VVIATTQPWPEIAECLRSLVDQASQAGAEILVADGSGQGRPPQVPASVRWLSAPGASVFQLRARAAADARGAIVAVTEDHCRVAPDWCRAILDAHRDHPEAAAIGGAVENGAGSGLLDWAHFFFVNGRFMAPLGPAAPVALQANVSYKRRALPDAWPALGMMEMLHNRALAQRGEPLVADDRIVVAHVQSLGLVGTCAAHVHNGRSIAGFRLAHVGRAERVLRLLGCVVLPPVMVWRTLRAVWPKRRRRGLVLASIPLMAVFACCHAAGEAIGYVAGPGTSPQRLR